MKRFKKIIMVLLSLILCILLFGCGDLKLKSNTEIKDDGSGTAVFQIVYDNLVSSSLNKTILDQNWLKDNGFLFNNYTKDGMNIEEVKYDFKSLKDLQQKLNQTKIINMDYSKKLGVGKDTYTINFGFDKDGIDKLIRENINTGNQQKDEQMYNDVKDVFVSNDITIPGTVLTSNYTEKTNDNIYEWNYKLSQISNDTAVTTSYSLKDNKLSIMLGAITIAIFGGLGYYIILKKNIIKH